MLCTTPYTTRLAHPRVTTTTTTTASGRGIQRPSRATSGCSIAAKATAATSQPSTRVDAAMSRSPASVAPNNPIATMTERVENRSRSVGWGWAMAYSTDVADLSPVGPPEPEPEIAPPSQPAPASASAGGSTVPVRVVDLDWRSVAVAMAALVLLIAATRLVPSAPHTLTYVAS